MRSYHFYLKAGKDLYLNMPTTSQGWIILNRFIPDYLYNSYGKPFVEGKEINSLDADEFERDCMRMVYCFDDNNLNYRDSLDCFTVYNAVVGQHVKQCGRIFIGDLLTYTSEMLELMSSMGYNDNILKDLCLFFIVAAIENNKQYVLDDAPNPFGPRSFLYSDRYKRLTSKCPDLKEVPKL